MADGRSTIAQVVQVGSEVTPGTPVTPTVQFGSISIAPSIMAENDSFRAMGKKFPTLVVPNKEWTEANIEGKPTYDEIVYLLASVINKGTVTPGSTTSQTWAFTPNNEGADDPQTYTVVVGDATQANVIPYLLVTALGIEFGRDAVNITGSALGQLTDVDGAIETGLAELPLIPVLPNSVDMYLDDTFAGIGTTQLDCPFTANFELSDRYGPVWCLDSSQESWSGTVETEPSLTTEVMMPYNDAARAFIAQMRVGDTKFLRIEATGPEAEAGVPHRLTIDQPVKVLEIGEFSDEDGVYALTLTLQGVYDETAGHALYTEVVNTLAALV